MYNEEIHILRAGELLYTLPLDDNAQCVHRLMGECTIELELRYEQPLLLQPGDYVEWNNVRYSLDEEPDYDNDEGIYVYYLTFYAYRSLNHIIHKDEGSMTFPYVGSAYEHLSALLKSIRDEDPEWELGTIEGEGTQSIDFDGTYCIDALTQICQAFGLEWRIENKTIHALKRVGTDTPYSFEVGQGKGLYTLEVKGVTNQKVTTRLYGYGAAINLPANYRANDIPKPDALVFDGRYLESNVDKYGVREDVVVFDDIFPRLKDVELAGVTVPVDPTAVSTWTVLVSLPFDINDHLAEEEAQIKFTSGELTGEAFVITSYNHTSGELCFSASDDNGYVLPSATRQPHVGDGFVLLNITMPDTYVTAAEEELRTATAEELVKRHEKAKAYTLDIDPRHVRNAQINVVPGDSVRVVDTPSRLDSAVRITEVSYPLQNPEKLSIVLSDTPLYASLADKIEADINNVSQGVNQIKNTSDTSLSFWNRAFEIRTFGSITAIVAKMHFVGSKTISQLGDGNSVPGEGGTGGSGTMYHELLEHLDWPNQHPIEAITGLLDALNGKLATSAISAWALQPEKPSYTWAEISGKPSAFTPAAHTHGMSEINGLSAALAGKLGVDHASDTTLHLTTGQRAVLAMLSVDTDGNLKIDGNAFTTGWLAQLGAATSEGGTGGGGTLYHDELEHLDYPDQHPIAAIAGLQSALNGKASTALVTTSASGLMSATDKAKLDGIAAGANNYVLPIASASVLGGIRVGSRLSIASGVLSANAQAWSEITGKPSTFTPAAHTQGWDTITGKPTTLSGYGITDAMTASAINTALAGKVATDSEAYMKTSSNITDANGVYQNLCGFGWAVANAPAGGDLLMINVTTTHNSYRHALQFASNKGEALWFRGRSLYNYTSDKKDEGWTAWRSIWHSGNFNPDSKLSLSGGTMSGQLLVQSTGLKVLGNTWANGQTASFFVDQYGFGVNCQNSAGNTVGQIRIHTQLNSPTFYTGDGFKKMWHEGNDGANSGLDADLLDGRHASEFWGHFLTTIDASALSEDYYYPVTVYIGYRKRVRISVMVDLDSKTKPSWSTHANGFSCRFIEEVSGDGWGAIAKNRVVLDSTYRFAAKNPIGKVDQMTISNNEVIWVRGGGKYYFYNSTDFAVTLRTTSFTAGGQTVSPILASSVTPEPYKAGDGLIGLSTLYCNSIVIGGHTITWDSTNNALKIDGNVYTTGSITQLKS